LNLPAEFPLIKLAKKLKELGGEFFSGAFGFPLIKLAKKLKVACGPSSIKEEIVSIN